MKPVVLAAAASLSLWVGAGLGYAGGMDTGNTAPPSAAELGIEDSEEAVLFITGASTLDRLVVGATEVEDRSPDLLIRELNEGLLSIRVEGGGRAWEGAIRLYRATVTTFDATAALASDEAGVLEEAEVDLFVFYDRLDALSSLEGRLAYCRGVLASSPPPPDDALVADACERLARKKELEAQTAAAEDETLSDDELDAGLLDEPEEEAERKLAELKRLYRPDGNPRKHPRGTALRWTVSGLGLAGSAAGIGLALHFETQAEQHYLLYRSAERVGDDPAMTRELFLTRDNDRQRDTSLGMAAVCLTTGIVAALFQRLEAKRFERYRASIEAGKDDE